MVPVVLTLSLLSPGNTAAVVLTCLRPLGCSIGHVQRVATSSGPVHYPSMLILVMDCRLVVWVQETWLSYVLHWSPSGFEACYKPHCQVTLALQNMSCLLLTVVAIDSAPKQLTF